MQKIFNIKIMLVFFLGHMLIAGAAFGDSPSMEDVQQELSEAMDAIRAYSEYRQAEAVKDMEAALKKMDDEIARLSETIQKKWEEYEPEARQKARETLARLTRLRDQLAASLEEWKTGGKITWSKMKEDLINAWEEFKKSSEDDDQRYDRPTIYL